MINDDGKNSVDNARDDAGCNDNDDNDNDNDDDDDA